MWLRSRRRFGERCVQFAFRFCAMRPVCSSSGWLDGFVLAARRSVEKWVGDSLSVVLSHTSMPRSSKMSRPLKKVRDLPSLGSRVTRRSDVRGDDVIAGTGDPPGLGTTELCASCDHGGLELPERESQSGGARYKPGAIRGRAGQKGERVTAKTIVHDPEESVRLRAGLISLTVGSLLLGSSRRLFAHRLRCRAVGRARVDRQRRGSAVCTR